MGGRLLDQHDLPLAAGQRGERLIHLVDHFGGVDGRANQLQLGALGARHRQQVVDEQAETLGLALDDPKFLQAFLVTNARQLGMAGRLLFPVPERGLSERLYRVRAKTILIWGDSDRVVSPVYAHEFKRLIEAGDEVIVTYESRKVDGKSFRNTEVHTFRGEKICRVEVYFGWDLE